MALISETSDDGSNGGDPNKKHEELNKNPKEEDQEEEEKQNESPNKDEEVENLAPIPQELTVVLMENTVALVRRCHYPKLSLISGDFRQVISSQELFVTRSQLGLTEPVLYALIRFPPLELSSWFILHRSNFSLRLSRITSLPAMFPGSTTVTIGHKMYVMGGHHIHLNKPVRTVLVIDCRFHTYRQLRSMQRDRCYPAAGVIDGKIYVVGGRKKQYNDWVEVFDVEREIWETVPGPYSSVASSRGEFVANVVLDNKIYILDGDYCLAYDPRRRTWQNWGSGSQQRFFWHSSSCVVDDLLYAIVPKSVLGSSIVVYDPRGMVWRPVKGVYLWPNLVYIEARMANFGGKLVILGCYQSWDSCDHDHYSEKNVWCIEVSLEKREDGDIWGKVESISRVHSSRKSPCIELSRTVTV